jgi:hypothetical protein
MVGTTALRWGPPAERGRRHRRFPPDGGAEDVTHPTSPRTRAHGGTAARRLCRSRRRGHLANDADQRLYRQRQAKRRNR